MYLFESFDSYISETRLYAPNNAKQSNPKVIVCAGAHLEAGENSKYEKKNDDFLPSCTIKMMILIINWMLKYENIGHIYLVI